MSTADFKQQQHDRVEEGKELQREDEMRDLSQIPAKELPGAQNQSLLSKISEGISQVASTISEKVGLSVPVVEGHEDLDKDVRKQVKKVNQEILKQAAKKGPEVEKTNAWKASLPKQVRKEIEEAAGQVSKTKLVKKIPEQLKKEIVQAAGQVPKAKPVKTIPKQLKKEIEHAAGKVPKTKPTNKNSITRKVKEGVHGLSESISHGVDNIKNRIGKENEEERVDDGTKHYKTVKDGFKENVDDLKHEQRVAALGGQEELSSKNPFQPLTSGNEAENRTLGEKIKGGLNDASQKISSTVGGVTQKVKTAFVHKEAQDKENAQQIA